MRKPIPRFTMDDLNEDHPPTALKELIFDLMLSWPNLEYGLTCWIAFGQNVGVSEAAIELGTTPNKNRIEKLRSLYAERDDQEAVDLLENIASEHETFVKVRNTVAHALLIGTSRSKPDDAYFLTTRAVPGEQGFMEVRRLAFSNFEEARDFAIDRATDIRDFLKARGVDVG